MELRCITKFMDQGNHLVLLHGAFNTINMAFGQLIPELSKNRQVIAVELQGHGHTADIDRPFSFQAMADDVAALLKYLKTDNADIFWLQSGWRSCLATGNQASAVSKKTGYCFCDI